MRLWQTSTICCASVVSHRMTGTRNARGEVQGPRPRRKTGTLAFVAKKDSTLTGTFPML